MDEVYFKNLAKLGWVVDVTNDENRHLPQAIQERYHWVPDSLIKIISSINEVVNESDTSWFIGWTDFYNQDSDSFRWNEWEIISLENSKETKEVISFWDSKFPVMMSVKNCYSYIAFCRSCNKSVSYTHLTLPTTSRV